MTIKGKAYVAGIFRAPDPARAGQDGGAAPRRGGARRARRRRRDACADVDGYFCSAHAMRWVRDPPRWPST